eukprot:SM000141S00832  [mRNA]  locus=s141:75801:77285:+ [translate_table: standard]
MVHSFLEEERELTEAAADGGVPAASHAYLCAGIPSGIDRGAGAGAVDGGGDDDDEGADGSAMHEPLRVIQVGSAGAAVWTAMTGKSVADCGSAAGCERFLQDPRFLHGLIVQSLLLPPLQGLVSNANQTERSLLSDVVEAMETAQEDATAAAGGADLRRAVMGHLRGLGYDAAICRTQWDHSKGFPGGEYEYIVVLGDEAPARDRLLVDLDFRAQFDIARPTRPYAAALAALPALFVGRPERLQRLVDLMSDSARRSLRRRGMHLPPWRRPEYMRAKWMAVSRHTTTDIDDVTADAAAASPQSLMGSAGRSTPDAAAVPGGGYADAGRWETSSILLEMELDNSGSGRSRLAGAGSGLSSPQPTEAASAVSDAAAAEAKAPWQPPVVKPKLAAAGDRKVAGLSSVLLQAGIRSSR